jgi:C4-dicarboxylate-specific signal transduction histidine kinase
MRWHVEWLLRLATEFYLVKFQTHELQRMGYLQAVYETGARVTHDVKNLLQSLQTLCYAAAQPGDPAAVAQLLARQLPQITERLKSTLDKLQRPQIEVSSGISAAEWWARLQDRHAGNGIVWRGDLRSATELPGALFDSVAENLLQNALAKRQHENGIEISVNLTVDRDNLDLSVRDTGQAIAPAIADALFREPVQSEFGLGIGLYHAAKQAEEAGYLLKLAENRPGSVAFRLARRN